MKLPLLFTALAILALLLSPASKWVILALGVLALASCVAAPLLAKLPEEKL